MRVNGREVKEHIYCQHCGSPAYFDHISSQHRRDGKKTIIYKCPENHISFDEIADKDKEW